MSYSLRYRLLAPSLAILILFGGAYSYFWMNHLSNETSAAFLSNGQKAVQSIAVPVATGIWEYDEGAVLDDLAALKEWDGFVFAQVLDQSGVFATFPADPRLPENWQDVLTFSPTAPSFQVIDGQYAFIAPLQHVEHGTIGHVVAVFSRDAINEMLYEIQTDAAVYAVIAISIFGAVLYLVAVSVTKPVTRVTEQIELAAAGDLDIRPTDTGRADEVGRLARAVEIFSNSAVELVSIRAKAEAAETVAKMASIDPLTELLNRRGLREIFRTSVKPPGISHIAFINIDLDDFKQVNDMHGHGVGDAVLCEVAARLQRCFPDAIAIARIGGDEFFVLHPAETAEASLRLGKKAIQDISQLIAVGVLQCRVAASAGIDFQSVAQFQAEQGVLNSDQALYQAKRDGKGSANLYDSALGTRIRHRQGTAEQIRAGLANDEFIPFFQPQVDSETLEIVGAEVLARWQRDDGTVLPPGAFLDVADELALTAQIDKVVAEKAIATFDSWAKDGVAVPPLSINVSGKRLLEPGLIEMMSKASKANLALNIELVEAIFLDDADDKTLLVLDQVRELGVGIEIDDFGTGHASIAGLIRVSPDTIKIDRQFIQNIVHCKQSKNLLKVFIDLARTFDMDVVAEGVESLDHVPILRAMGIGRLQGYAFSKPQPADEFLHQLNSSVELDRPLNHISVYSR